ncbi:MAG: glycosyltransferase family 9 protein [Chlorobaculum sp.]
MSKSRSISCQTTFRNKPESVVILARECFGDVIMLTPLIAALKKKHPGTKIYIVAFTKIVYDFFREDRNISGTYLTKRALGAYFFKFLPKQYDVLFNSKDHKSTSFLLQSRLIRARYKVGFRNNGNEALFDFLLELPKGTHESQRNLALLQALDGQLPEMPRPYIPEMPVAEAINKLLEQLPENSFIGINISAGTPGGHRTIEQWADLIRNFPNERFVIFSAPGDLEVKRQIEAPHQNVLPSPATKNLYEVWKIVDKLKLLVTPDTSLVHVAACSDKPVVALYRYNPDDRKLFAPLSTLQEVVTSSTQEVMDISNQMLCDAVRNMLKKLECSNAAD